MNGSFSHPEQSQNRPVLLFDGKCSFCRIWINYWRKRTGDRIEYLASQDAMGPDGADRFPQIPQSAYKQSVQLVRSDGSVASGARAVAESLEIESWYAPFAIPAEAVYRFVANHRDLGYQVTRFTFGTRIEPTRFAAIRWLFLRMLALIYLIAFGSLAMQVKGLIGQRGISPAGIFLDNVLRGSGNIRYLAVPSIFWFGVDDVTLQGMCFAGMGLAFVLILVGFRSAKFERLILLLLWLLYLSFAAVGQEFLGFQWDSLLLETGFLAIFLSGKSGESKVIPWLFRWLGFRLMFLSGAVKLLGGDPTWHNLSALGFHWHTQPLPTVLAWYADKLPPSLDHAATWLTLAIETLVPFTVFFPRRIRMAGACILIGLQVLILLTGNYTFFNLLTMALLLFWFDDQAMEGAWLGKIKPKDTPALRGERPTLLARVVALVILALGLLHLLQTFYGRLPAPAEAALRYTAPLQIVNTYGLFAQMTTSRMEISFEGSDDGGHWAAYEFKYKPGNPKVAPRWVAPYQPRLDWQMWFAALGTYQENIWLVNLAVRLLEGVPEVTDLLGFNPFQNRPPRFVRAFVYEYSFSGWETRRQTGEWWRREPRGVYLPPVGLKAGSPQ
jgi:predicted DCC family thiol-disulfide oxidoreductase YuxK